MKKSMTEFKKLNKKEMSSVRGGSFMSNLYGWIKDRYAIWQADQDAANMGDCPPPQPTED